MHICSKLFRDPATQGASKLFSLSFYDAPDLEKIRALLSGDITSTKN